MNPYFDIMKLNISESTIYSSEKPFHFEQLKFLIDKYVIKPSNGQDISILDCTSHVGGFCIRSALAYPESKVDAVEYDKEIYDKLLLNVEELKVNNIECRLGCGYEFVKNTDKKYSICFIDPPWPYAKAYIARKDLQLFLGTINAIQVIQTIFDRNVSDCVLFKIPRNYKMSDLETLVGVKYTIYNIKSQNPRKPVPDYLVAVITREPTPRV